MQKSTLCKHNSKQYSQDKLRKGHGGLWSSQQTLSNCTATVLYLWERSSFAWVTWSDELVSHLPHPFIGLDAFTGAAVGTYSRMSWAVLGVAVDESVESTELKASVIPSSSGKWAFSTSAGTEEQLGCWVVLCIWGKCPQIHKEIISLSQPASQELVKLIGQVNSNIWLITHASQGVVLQRNN